MAEAELFYKQPPNPKEAPNSQQHQVSEWAAESEQKANSPQTQTSGQKQGGYSSATLDLAYQDVCRVMGEQGEQSQILTTKLNILFAVNVGLLTSLAISKLILVPSLLSFGEALGFLVSFTLLFNAFLPRQVAVGPNLDDQGFLERYLNLPPSEYRLKMIVNLVETYNINKQRLDDKSRSLTYAAYATIGLASLTILHLVLEYFDPTLRPGAY